MQTELYVEAAVRNSLLSEDSQTAAILASLATLAMSQHHDYWLNDFLHSTPNKTAYQALISAIKHNQSGSPQDAASEAKVAFEQFVRIGNRAGAARSEFEFVYALQRQSLADKCRSEAMSLKTLVETQHYSWLKTQTELELASCDGMLAQFDSALQHAAQAAKIACLANYPILYLRALGFQASIESAAGRNSESWTTDVRGLDKFWREALPADRGYQFYSDLELEAESGSRFALAALLQREALVFAEESSRTDILAIGHFRLGSLFHVLGDNDAAQREFGTSYELFSKLPNTGSSQLYKQYCEILLATLDLLRGSDESAKDLLSRIDSVVINSTNFSLQLAYWRAAAELAEKLHDGREQQYLRNALTVASGALTSLRTEQEKWNWDLQIRDLERRMFYLSAVRYHDASQSFAAWQKYNLAQRTEYRARSASSDTSLRPGNISQDALQLHNSTLITYAVLPHHLFLWIADDRGIENFDIPIKAAQLDTLVREFYRLCSDPTSSEQKIKAVGLRLYELLFGRVRARLDPSRTLFIQPDGILGLVPWGALTTTSGKYLLETETIASTEGLMRQPLPHKKARRSNILAVYPGAVSFHGRKYLPLPDAEVELSSMPRNQTMILQGHRATALKVLQLLSIADVLYFAGHAENDDHGGQLILQGKSDGASLSAADISRLNLSHVRLAILAACNTAFSGTVPGDPNALPHSFLKAGVKNVIASGWAVDSSSTRDLMVDLLDFGGQIGLKSLRNAELSIKQHPYSSHPYYWASFQLYGEPGN